MVSLETSRKRRGGSIDIGERLRDFGPVDIKSAAALVAMLTEADWTSNTLRQDVLARGTQSIT